MAISFENTDEWIILLNQKEASYNKKKFDFCNKIKDYYKQHTFATNITEDELLTDIEELSALKRDMQSIRENILSKSRETMSNPNFLLFRV